MPIGVVLPFVLARPSPLRRRRRRRGCRRRRLGVAASVSRPAVDQVAALDGRRPVRRRVDGGVAEVFQNGAAVQEQNSIKLGKTR